MNLPRATHHGSALGRGICHLAVVIGAGFLSSGIWLAVRESGWGGAFPAALLGAMFGAAAMTIRTSTRWLLALVSTLLALSCLELGTAVWVRLVKSPDKTYHYEHSGNPDWFAEHRLVGYALRGRTTLWATASVGNTAIYSDVQYDLDEFGRRPCRQVPDAPQHALFFGGSFTFGEGLSNPETLPCQFQEATGGRYRSWSYSMMGWGPAQAAVMLGVDSLFEDVEPRRGIAVFSFIADHVNRTVWRPGWSTEFPYCPLYDLDHEGRLVGPIRAAELDHGATTDRLVRFFTRESPVFREFVLPVLNDRVHDPRAVRITAMVLAEAANLYRRRFDGSFVVLIWPRARLAPGLEDIFVDALEQRGVPVVFVDPLPGEAGVGYLHPLDSHPNAREASWVARQLAATVDLMAP